MLTSIGQGCIKSLEEFLHQEFNSGTRRPPNLEKISESLLQALHLTIDGRTFFFFTRVIERAIERASIQSRDRKKLMNRLRHLNSERESEIYNLLIALCDLRISPSSFMGYQSKNHGDPVEFWGSNNWCRTRHCIGLAVAVDLSMTSLGVTVKFPRKVNVRSPCKGSSFRNCRVVFRNGQYYDSLVLNRLTTKDRRFRLLVHYLKVLPRERSELPIVKVIKTSLVKAFGQFAGQELPEGSTFALFPETTQRKLDNLFSTNREQGIRFYKHILESKSLCSPVGVEIIDKAYRDHKESLCRDPSDVLDVPSDILQELYQYGVQVGRRVSKLYNPFQTKLPNRRATVEKSRQRGGAREALKDQFQIQKGPLYLHMMDRATRPEPWVIGLFGPPGSGKTTSVVNLVSIIGSVLYSSVKKENLVYSRSCSTKHWDGYEGQPIVVLDDMGQGLQDRSDLVEFEQLVSTNRYVLPMADLPDKGTCFVSPIIIVTSNVPYGSRLLDNTGQPIMEDAVAFWRRFHFPLLVSKTKEGRKLFREFQMDRLYNPRNIAWWGLRHAGSKNLNLHGDSASSGFPPYDGANLQKQAGYEPYLNGDYNGLKRLELEPYLEDIRSTLSEPMDVGKLIPNIIDRFRVHMDFHADYLSSNWRQDVACLSLDIRQGVAPLYDVDAKRIATARLDNDVTASIFYPSFPPYELPIVDAIAIPEPLKVRMITKAQANTKALKPFQMALFKYMKSVPQFGLTHGLSHVGDSFGEKLRDIEKIEQEIKTIFSRKSEGELWLSGDYKSATDNFPLSVTQALIEGILSQIDHDPTKRWVRYEVSPHIIRYPDGTRGVQTSGQLMGSLISFPLLCFLNDFIVRKAGFREGQYLINGDDVVALGSPSVISSWRELAPQVGLNLSLGKNFIDPEFCCINSQLFWHGEVRHTGKLPCAVREDRNIGACYSMLQYSFGNSEAMHRQFIRDNLLRLRATPRSLDVPTSHGGFALNFSRAPGVDLKLAKEVYLYDFLRKFAKSLPVPGYPHIRAIPFPVGLFSNEESSTELEAPDEEKVLDLLMSLDFEADGLESPELTHSELGRHRRTLQDHDRRLNQLLERPLSQFPPLHEIRSSILWVQKGKVGFIKKKVIGLCLDVLLDRIDHPIASEVDPESMIEVIRNEALLSVLDDLVTDPEDGDQKACNFLWDCGVDPQRYQQLLPDIQVHPSRLEILPHDLKLLQLLELD